MYYSRVVAIQIRDVPDGVRTKLAALAKSEGKSLQQFLLELLIEEARWGDNAAIMAAAAATPGGWAPTPAEHQEFIDRMKAERDDSWKYR